MNLLAIFFPAIIEAEAVLPFILSKKMMVLLELLLLLLLLHALM
jgi:hypothetical protein